MQRAVDPNVSPTTKSTIRVYAHVNPETTGAWSVNVMRMTFTRRHRRGFLAVAATVLLVAGAAATAVALNRSRVASEREITRPLAVGDCVAAAASPPGEVWVRRSSCADDPSYTIGALADTSGTCPTAEYQHFPAPAADRVTAGLCLVPNLVADHCYRLGMPVGVVARADCAGPRTGGPDSGVLVQVTRRLDTHDRHACPSEGGSFSWPYPSPARTYCTSTLY